MLKPSSDDHNRLIDSNSTAVDEEYGTNTTPINIQLAQDTDTRPLKFNHSIDALFEADDNNDNYQLIDDRSIILTKHQYEQLKNWVLSRQPNDLDQNTVYNCARAIKQNLYPGSLGLLLVVLLENTSLFTAIWERDPSYHPQWYAWLIMALTAIGTSYNNHVYASLTSGLTQNEVSEQLERIDSIKRDAVNSLKDDIFHQVSEEQNVSLEEQVKTILRCMTRPSMAYRLLTDLRAFASYFIKLSATCGILFAEFEAIPLWALLPAAFVGGTAEGIDIALINAICVGGEHQSLNEIKNGLLPPLVQSDRGFLFPKLADFTPIPWIMAKLGPALWVIVKYFALTKWMELTGITDEQVPGGLLGLRLLVLLSAYFDSCVFSIFNIDQQLAKELPTQRDFEYKDTPGYENWLKAAMGGLLLPGAVGCGIYASGKLQNTTLIPIVGAIYLATIVAIKRSPNFSRLYASVFEARCVEAASNTIDSLHIADQAAIAVLGAVSSGLGMGFNSAIPAALGQATLFLGATAMLSTVSRNTASVIRYVPAQMFIYATAILAWVLNFIFPMHRLTYGQNPSDRPTRFNYDDFGKGGYISLVLGTLLIGWIAGDKYYRSTGEKTNLAKPVIEGPHQDGEGNKVSLIGRFFSGLGNCAQAICKTNNSDEADISYQNAA